MSELFDTTVLIGILASTIRLATPYLYAAIGEMFGQRSGVLNLGVDGVMLLGAFAAYYTVILSGNAWLGLLAALLVGVVMGVILGVVNVSLKATQGISGIGVYLFGLGLNDLLFQKFVGTARSVRGFQELPIPFLSELPVVGKIFSA